MLREWVKALRSGKYAFGKGCLRDNNKYCCLGVYADLMKPHAWKYVTNEGKKGVAEWMGGRAFLPDGVMNRAIQEQLADMNDNMPTHVVDPFHAIANWICDNLTEVEGIVNWKDHKQLEELQKKDS